MPSRLSPYDRRKRSLSPSNRADDRDRNRDRPRRRLEETTSNEKSSRSQQSGPPPRTSYSTKRSSSDHEKSGVGSSKRHRSTYYEQRTRGGGGRRSAEDEDNEDSDEGRGGTRVSRFVGERKPDGFSSSSRLNNNYESSTLPPDNRNRHHQQQSYHRNEQQRSFMPPRWEDSTGGRRDYYYDRGSRGGAGGGAGAGYSRRNASFGRWGGGRGGRGGASSTSGRGRDRTIIYRPGEDEDKPTMNLFDPTNVPKGRNYFEHEDRCSDDRNRAGLFGGRGRGGGRYFRAGGFRGGYSSLSSGWRRPSNDYSAGGRTDDVWQHDMFEDEDVVDRKTEPNNDDVSMEEAK